MNPEQIKKLMCEECEKDYMKLKKQLEETQIEYKKLKVSMIESGSTVKIKKTNFDILTASPERLANYLYKITEHQYNYNALLEYLNKKCER